MSETFKIQLQPNGRDIKAQAGQSLMEALVNHSIFLRSDCGGKGKCGKCKVNILGATGAKESVTSCIEIVQENLKIEIPESSMLSTHIITKAPVVFPTSFEQKVVERLLSLQNTKKDQLGIAVDLGTTTIAVYLCNTTTAKVLSSIAIKNPQALYGDDVMTRISAVNSEEGNLEHLQKLVVNSIEWGIIELLNSLGLQDENVQRIVAVGNPTMIQILAGLDPKSIGSSPFTPAFYKAKNMGTEEVGFNLKNIPLQFLPQISGFIGGDILSAALAVDLSEQPEGTLLIDLGTNGELLLKGKGKIFATSCATGPAFEGATLSCGMQAIPGAINKVTIQNAEEFPDYSIINPKNSSKLKPFGVCGTGVISGVAEFCRNNIVQTSGAFAKLDTLKPLQPDGKGSLRYTLVDKDASLDESEVYINQKDIRSVQLGKGALITGIEFLLEAAGYEKPEKILIAGAFGSYIDKNDMITLGMIPDIDPDKIEVAGNSAGAGAVMVLCDENYLQKAIELADNITTIELAFDPNFQKAFVQNLSFPTMQN